MADTDQNGGPSAPHREPKRRAWLELALGTLALAGASLFVALRLNITTDITHFLPSGDAQDEVELARQLALGELSRTLVVLVDGEDTDAALAASDAFQREIAADEELTDALAFLDASAPEGVEEALWQLYMPRRYSFIADSEAAARDAASDAALRANAASLRDKLASPLSGLVTRVAPRDPTLVLPSLFERLAGGRGEGLTVRDGKFLTEDEGAAVLFLGTKAPATDAPTQKKILAGIERAFERAADGFDPRPMLSMSGAHRFAVRTEAAISSDIRRVSIGSALGLCLLLVVFFRSARLVALILPVTAAAFLGATATCLALFGSVHGLTIAFGAAMIGVSIDFAIHFHCHDSMAPSAEGPRQSLRAIWPALALSAATTAIGFLVLCASSFQGLRELAIFGAVGIFCALGATRVFLPALTEVVPGRAHATPFAFTLVRRMESLLRPGRHRALMMAPALAIAALSLWGLPQLRWSDDIADMSRLDADLVAEDDRVRGRVVRFEQRRLVVARGATEEDALRANDAAAAVLSEAKTDGVIGGARGIATLLPSQERQRTVDAAFRSAPDLWPRMRAALEDEGFRPDPFEAFAEDLAAEPPAPLRFDDLAQSALAPLARPFRVTLDDGVGFVTFLHDLGDADELAMRLSGVEGASLVDIESVLGGAYGAYRVRMAWLLSLGLLLVLGLLVARHRALRPSLAAYLPAVLAGLGTVSILSILGLQLNMLSLVALLMVVGLGVDYGVLLAETRSEPESLRATYFAILVAASSTLVGFGMLSLSAQPSLFVIGATASIGVALSLVLAPTVGSLLASSPSPHDVSGPS